MRKKLKNGIVVVMEKRELPVVALSITNRFGGAFEESKIKGIAHFIEHLVLTGTKTRTHEDISREIEKRGGLLNAFTAHEVTSFWFKLPSEHLFAGLNVLTDIINNPIFDKDKFEKEKKVIIEEIKMYHDNPRLSVMEQIEKNLYEKPFGDLIIGSKETVSRLDRDFVAAYFKENYNPENYIVTVVGNADFEKICTYLEENFKPNKSKYKVKEIKKKNAETYEERAGIDQAHFVFGAHAPLALDNRHYALEVLDSYLANGMSSRLFLEIREKRGLAYVIKSDIAAEESYSHYLIYVGTTKETVSEVKKIILEELENIKNMSEKDLEEAKERAIGLRRVLSEESANVMNELMFFEMIGKSDDYYKYDENIGKVKLDDVKVLASALSKKYSVAAVVPK